MSISRAKLKNKIKDYAYNIQGWKTSRKLIIFESDDWGSERTPDREGYNLLLRSGLSVDKCPFGKFDTLESSDDLTALFEVLESIKDKNGRHAVITANFNLANPDFDLINKASFESYYYKNYEQTLEIYKGRDKVVEILKEGLKKCVFFPQYHSREHLNPLIWLDEIRNGNAALRIGFQHGVFALSKATSPEIIKFHLASMLFRNNEEQEEVRISLADGYRYFESIFGFKPESFVAPIYTWNEVTEQQLLSINIKLIQTSCFQKYFRPFKTESFQKKFKKMGSINSLGQMYTVRNCIYEPSITPNRDNVGDCLHGIKAAFFMGAPAVISTHRLNFTGGVDESNRKKNLLSFKLLLNEIVKLWPDVEFINSVELGKIILSERFA